MARHDHSPRAEDNAGANPDDGADRALRAGLRELYALHPIPEEFVCFVREFEARRR